MLLSYKHKFIFMHCPKTAGSAVTASLARYSGPRDVQVGVHVDTIRLGIRPNRSALLRLATYSGGMAFIRGLRHGVGIHHAFNSAVKRSYTKIFPGHRGHPSAQDVKRAYPAEWDAYFKFSIVRNPFDRMVSHYHWCMKRLHYSVPFAEFVRAVCEGRALGRHDWKVYDFWRTSSLNGGLAVDYVIRYETLAADLDGLTRRIGIEWDGWLPDVKVSSNRRKYQEYYTQSEVDLMKERFRREIELFGYEF